MRVGIILASARESQDGMTGRGGASVSLMHPPTVEQLLERAAEGDETTGGAAGESTARHTPKPASKITKTPATSHKGRRNALSAMRCDLRAAR